MAGGARFYPDGRPQGRPPGSRNKRTTNQILDAKRSVAEARSQGRKLAKEVADDFMHIFANMALEVRPITERERARGAKPNPKADEAKFKSLCKILLDWVALLLPFQSARLALVRLNIAEEIGDDRSEDANALAKLEQLLDAYAKADEEERAFRAAREVKEVVEVHKVEPDPAKVVALRPPGKC
jgi:hypothetical protein